MFYEPVGDDIEWYDDMHMFLLPEEIICRQPDNRQLYKCTLTIRFEMMLIKILIRS